jgi:hypothetical protein
MRHKRNLSASIWIGYCVQMRLAFAIIGWLGVAAASRSEEIEITGLVDFGNLRMAFVKVGDPGLQVTLSPGQSVRGVTLRDFNSKEGWALFLQGTNESKIWLHSYCTTSSVLVPGSGPPTAPQPQFAAGGEAAGQNLVDGESGEVQGAAHGLETARARYTVPPDAPMTPWLRAYLDAKQTPHAPETGSQAPVASGEAVPKSPATPVVSFAPSESISVGNPSADTASPLGIGGGMVSEPGTPASLPSPNPALNASEAVSPAEPVAAAISPVSAADALEAEGEMIRGFYGVQAFFAWDMAHRNRN